MTTCRRVISWLLTLVLGAWVAGAGSVPPPPLPSYPGAAHWMAVHFPKAWHAEGFAAERGLFYSHLPSVAAPAGRRFVTWKFGEPLTTTWHGRVIHVPKFAVMATEVSRQHRQRVYGVFLEEGSPPKWVPWPNWSHGPR